ncbi:MAG: glycine--tRNA ligase subunit beta [Terriglobales bacterium]
MNHDLLIELGSEEIPARMVSGLAQQFADQMESRLAATDLIAAAATNRRVFWTPRRVAVVFPAVAQNQPDRDEEQVGPPARLAFAADGALTVQAKNFAAKFGAAPTDLYRVSTLKGEYVAVRRHHRGQSLAQLLDALLPEAFAALDLPKAMQWQGRAGAKFVRPLRWLLVLHGAEILPVRLAGLMAGRQTRGHRGLAQSQISIESAMTYEEQLRLHFVIAAPQERAATLQSALPAVAGYAGGRHRSDPNLLTLLRDLTENPGVLAGSFAKDYLELPGEVLVTVMRDHQKYFALEDAEGRLLPGFCAVTDLAGEPREEREAIIRHGHERVLRARFNDARFFWQTDRKRPLFSRLEDLKQVTFQARLGNYHAKTDRNLRLAKWLAEQWHADETTIAIATPLAKCDLTTELVKEFTELQGKIGGLYAEAEGHSPAIRDAIYFQYEPLSTEGPLPPSAEAAALGVADKLDTIAGMFLAGEIPTGSRDPFALRRQANGIIRTLLERTLTLDLNQAQQEAMAGYAEGLGDRATALSGLQQFFQERLEFYLREVGGYALDTVRAVLTVSANDPLDALRRVQAVTSTRQQAATEFAAAAAAMKRIRNIVRKENWTACEWNKDLLQEAAEGELAHCLELHRLGQGGSDIDDRPEIDRYKSELLWAADTGEVLERFFTTVRVNAEDPRLRANRLGLLAWAAQELSQVADFSEIVLADG